MKKSFHRFQNEALRFKNTYKVGQYWEFRGLKVKVLDPPMSNLGSIPIVRLGDRSGAVWTLTPGFERELIPLEVRNGKLVRVTG